MNSTLRAPNSQRLNVLALDGGGVRGLSSLLILQRLMQQINLSIKNDSLPGEAHRDVQPHDVFDLVGGTSTGGLISIMLGKLGMTLEQCIEAYHNISQTIFGKKHFTGRITAGLAPSRYSGERLKECVRGLLKRHHHDEDLGMVSSGSRDKIACAVICREHETESRYSDFKPAPVCICSLPCPNKLLCLVCEAARATSAAPTYFPVQKIQGRSFVDGGIEFNNPSFAIFDHYSASNRVAESRRTSVIINGEISPTAHHGNLDFSMVRIVNLGTGTKPDFSRARRPGILTQLVPPFIRYGAFLKKTLTKCAVNSENTASHMRTLARVSAHESLTVKYERFSADNGVCYIKLDKVRDLEKIESLTREYLETPTIQRALARLGAEIATDYLGKPRPDHNIPDRLNVPDRHDLRSTSPGPRTPPGSPPETDTRHSDSPRRETETSSGANSTSTEPFPYSTHTTGSLTVTGPIQAIPPRKSENIIRPVEPMIDTTDSATGTLVAQA